MPMNQSTALIPAGQADPSPSTAHLVGRYGTMSTTTTSNGNGHANPSWLSVEGDGIPQALRDRKHWVGWRAELKPGKNGKPEKWTKTPYRLNGLGHASSTNPATWAPYGLVWSVTRAKRFNGVGFALGDGIFGIDLDHCLDRETGIIEPWATEIVNAMPTYWEVTPSGCGLRAFAFGQLPGGGVKKGNTEIYDRGRYLTVTGHHLPGTPTDLQNCNDAIQPLYRRVAEGGKKTESPKDGTLHRKKSEPAEENSDGPTDAEIIAKIERSKNGEEFKLLWAGTWQGAYPSQSEADLALMNMIVFWTGPDDGRADALFRQSGLMREKWDERHFGDGATYGQHTIARALEGRTEFFDWTWRKKKRVKRETRISGGVAEVINAKPEIPPFVPFPTEALPAVVRDFIRQGSRAIGCDESFITLPLLAVLAAAIGNSRRILLKHSWAEPCIVWAVVVGDSGTLKSPALDLALEPLQRLQTVAFAKWKERLEEYERDKQTHEADVLEWKKTGRKKGEPAPSKPEEPEADRYLCADATVESLAVLLERSPRGLLMARDELSGWVNSFDAYKSCRGADVAHWLSMHRAGLLTVDRKTGRKVIHVPRAAICITGTVQPKSLAAALCGRYQAADVADTMERPDKEHFDNGLASRLLFCMPPARPKHWTDEDMPEEAKAPMRRLVNDLLALEMGQDDEGEPVPIDVPLSVDGKTAWVAFYNAHAAEIAKLHGDLAAAWSKLEGYAARFALLVHLVRLVSGESVLFGVDEHSVAAGVTLARWCADEAARVYAVIGGDVESPEAREQRELVRIIQAHGGAITTRELMHASRRYRASVETAEAALGRLVVADLATVYIGSHSKGGGRPVDVYALLNSTPGNTTPVTPEENGVVLPLPGEEEEEIESPPENCTTGTPQDTEEAEWIG
jgi:hypothetical protein